MKKINLTKIEKTLRKVQASPSRPWQAMTIKRLEALADQDVTDKGKRRNQHANLFNLLNFLDMDAKVKLLAGVGGAIFTLGALGGGVVYASDASKPGDILFSLDKSLENFQRRNISDPAELNEFEVKILEEREEELAELEEENDQEDIEEAKSEVEEQEDRVEDEEEDSEDEETETPSVTPSQTPSDDDNDDEDNESEDEEDDSDDDADEIEDGEDD